MMDRLKIFLICIFIFLFNTWACTPDFDDFWQVKDLRILAIQAEPPEILLSSTITSPPSVHLNALVVDPLAPTDQFEWQYWACTAEETRCDLAQQKQLVKDGQSTLEEIKANFVLSESLYQAALAADPQKGFGGLPVMIELRVQRESFSASSVKRLVYGLTLPPNKTPNRNPSISKVIINDQAPLSSLTVPAGGELKLLPESPISDKEKYVVTTYSGGSREFTEYLRYSFFSTTGNISDPSTGGSPSIFVENKKTTDISSKWTAPIPARDSILWIIVRDDRGGVGWITLPAKVQP